MSKQAKPRHLTKKQIEEALASSRSAEQAAAGLGLSSGAALRYWIKQHGIDYDGLVLAQDEPREFFGKLRERRMKKADGMAFVLTAAQNDTSVNERFLENLKAFCAHVGAELMIAPFFHNPYVGNPSAVADSMSMRSPEWHPMLGEWLVKDSVALSPSLAFMSGINIVPTRQSPLAGMETLPSGDSAVYAHPRIEMRLTPTKEGKQPLVKVTTGAVTNRNYSKTIAGSKGDHHHSYSATYVKFVDGKKDKFFCYQLSASESGEFQWFDVLVKGGKVKTKAKVEGLVLGDLHAAKLDWDGHVKDLKGVVRDVKPNQLVVHDAFDGVSISHHVSKSFAERYKRWINQKFDALKDELDYTEKVLGALREGSGCDKLHIVASNHDDSWLWKWVEDCQNADDPKNARLWLYCREEMMDSMGNDNMEFIPLRCLLNDPVHRPASVWFRFHHRGSSLLIAGIECALHGDVGASGSRGSPRQIARYDSKSVIGHSHVPGICDGVYTVGISGPVVHAYSRGYSSWANAHCVIYPSGKRSILFQHDGRVR